MAIYALFRHTTGYEVAVEFDNYIDYRNYKKQATTHNWHLLEAHEEAHFNLLQRTFTTPRKTNLICNVPKSDILYMNKFKTF